MVQLFGHRGAAGEAPENTMEGYQFAYSLGVRCLELDVHLTKDGDLAVIHDETLDRTTDGKGHVGGYTMDELRRFHAYALFAERWPEARISSLREVMEVYSSKMSFFQVEIKTDRPFILDMVCKQVMDTLGDFDITEKTIVTSFDPYAIRAIRLISPRQKCGLISMSYKESDIHLAKELGCWNTCIPLKTGGSRELVHKAQSLGLEVTGWLGNSLSDVDTLLDWGVDSITTNFPSLVLPYLEGKA
ncbi:MAG: hypothetical protein CVV53_05305 [Spirochaetae bacterium HGW-Spirochaetae-9]|nr:MAG: hypothetical protein CVV53_05305 [Spirochaetae bacterium HGW-Spirochaetae-9]